MAKEDRDGTDFSGLHGLMRSIGRSAVRQERNRNFPFRQDPGSAIVVPMTSLDYLDTLNAAQRQAVIHGTAGPAGQSPPLLVIAGAGSGKTGTLAHRVAHLILAGIDPRRILLLTFSRRAAQEMARRVANICAAAFAGRGLPGGTRIDWSGTFHAVAVRLLRHYAHQIGLDPAFTIVDREDAADLIDLARDELGLSTCRNRFPRKATCLAIYSYAVNAGDPLSVVLNKAFPWCTEWEDKLKRLFAVYVEAKAAQNVLDYDDLLLYWAEMMRVPDLASDVAGRFDHVLVDEYQDTNALQAAILLGLKSTGQGLTVVGDDAQAIYSFRAATVRNILDFPALFDPPATVVTMDRNYRSTQVILDACNAVISAARDGFPKTLCSERQSPQKPRLVSVEDESAQVDYVVDHILAARESGVSLHQQAVLFRAAHHSGPLEVELTRRNIPFVKYGGLRFLDAAHVKDVIGLLRWAENPRDRVAGFRILQLLPGVGPATAGKALDAFRQANYAWQALERFRSPTAAADDWPLTIRTLALLQTGGVEWSGQPDLALDWYRPHLERLYESPQARLSDVEQLTQIAATYPNRRAFLEDLTLDPPGATSDEAGAPALDEDTLVLSTIHSAKGQEWRSVFVLNVVDGCIPSDMATVTSEEIEEERRLLYVAMTRAKDDLHLIMPQRFFTRHQPHNGNRHVYAARSRFIASAILDRFEVFAWSPHGGVAARTPPCVDLAQRLRSRWA
jgi:DNA helicase-2/ATP-dependent DNA helicase PcrA